MLPESDRIRIRHMLEAAEQALSFVEGRKRADLDTDPLLRLALLRALEVMGEAAGRVSEESRNAYPQIPWRQMAGTRNRLIHAYFDIDLDVVSKTVTRSVPALVSSLRRMPGPQDPR